MAQLDDLDDLDLTTVELEDGTPLLVAWRPGPDGSGTWVAREALPASAVQLQLDPMRNRMTPDGFLPAVASVQDVITSLLRDGFNTYRLVTDEDPDGPTQARSFLLTDYRRALGPTDIGSNGSLFGLTYGRAGAPAGGFANITTIVGEVRASEDPANEIGGTIASLQLGRGQDPPPTASLWGSSYTLRGSVGRQPGGLMAYTAVVQNYFDGTGSRSLNYGYAAITRPGIGDGADFHVHDPIRDATTYPIDLGFVVCGDSGPNPEGGGIGYRVAFQAGGGASPWSPPEHWRSRIGTGLVVRDWVEGGIHIHPPLPDAGEVAHIRLDRRDGAGGNLLECRTEDGTHVLTALRADGRLSIADGTDFTDAVSLGQLDAVRHELADAIRSLREGPADLSATPTRALGAELARRLSPARPTVWRSLRRRAARLRASVRTP
jgi:hypothetical protein